MSDSKENIFKKELAYNKNVEKNLSDIRSDIEQCHSTEDIINTFQSYENDKELVYKNNIFYTALLITLLTAGGAAYSIYLTQDFGATSIILLVASLIFLTTGLIYKKNDDGRQNLISFIEDTYLEKKYQFQEMAEQKEIAHNEIVSKYDHLFRKGNYKNNIPYFASGVLAHNQKALPYTVFQYHFVDKRTETYRENGKTKKRVVYDHYDNWGIFISNIQCTSFSITDYKNKHFKNKWTTSSIDFNKRHFITGGSEIELAKLMQPANVLMFEKLFSGHPTFELTCNNVIPTICWNFNWNILQRINKSANNCTTAKQFSGHLAELHMPEYETLMKDLNPLLDKMVL